MNIEIFLSLLNWLYIIKKSYDSVKYVFHFTREVKICIFHLWLRLATHEIYIFSTALNGIKAIFNKI